MIHMYMAGASRTALMPSLGLRIYMARSLKLREKLSEKFREKLREKLREKRRDTQRERGRDHQKFE